MRRIATTVAALVLAITTASAAYAAPPSSQPQSPPAISARALGTPSAETYGTCWRRLGPFPTRYRAYQVRAAVQSRGYAVGPVYGQGGVVSRSARYYYFRVYYRC